MSFKIKVCGLTDLVDVRAAMAAGADMLGFIFFAGSPRCVKPEQVRRILDEAQPNQAGFVTVGVFVNDSPQHVAQVLDFCGLDFAQLHGDEPPAALGNTSEDRGPLCSRAYKALRPRSIKEASHLAQSYALPPHLRSAGRLPAFLIDAYHPTQRGGTGETGDWRLAQSLAGRYPLLLAGGLTPANVAQAIHSIHPWGVDVASGVEQSPGRKDHAALRAFFSAVKQAERIDQK